MGAPERADAGPWLDATSADVRDATASTVSDSGLAADASAPHDAGVDGAAERADAEAGAPIKSATIYLAGDSTVSTYADTANDHDQAGWGQMLQALFQSAIRVDNRAIGGRTARRFLDEKRLDGLLESARPGDYVFVQFGTNDGNRSATYELDGKTYPYYADPQTDFKTNLQVFVDRVKERGATPVLVTPPPRNTAYCTGGNGTGAHAQAMRELGTLRSVAVLDLNTKSVAYLKAICPAPAVEDFFLRREDGSVDGTHFQERGARMLAKFVAEEIAARQLPLAAALR
jgi:lysophospholipase L1-like esterase